MKTCNKCKIEKPYEDFHKCSKVKDGHNGDCKECRLGHKPHKKILEGLKICINCNTPKEMDCFGNLVRNGILYKQSECKTCRNRKREAKLSGTDKYKIRKGNVNYRSKLKSKYNITIDIYNKMLVEQNDCCKICGNPETKLDSLGNIQRLSVDHCHSTDAVRGLLCGKCNVGLGSFKDSIKSLKMAIQYLEETNTDKSV